MTMLRKPIVAGRWCSTSLRHLLLALAGAGLPLGTAVAEPHAPAVLNAPSETWSPFRYVNVAGTALRPRSSTSGWNSPGGSGCLSVEGGGGLFVAPVNLPHGSRIDYLRVYFYDTSAVDGFAFLVNYNATGDFSDLTMVQTEGLSGYGTALSPYIGHVVDTYTRAYVLAWNANQTGPTMRLCGLRIAYRVSELIFRDGFEG